MQSVMHKYGSLLPEPIHEHSLCIYNTYKRPVTYRPLQLHLQLTVLALILAMHVSTAAIHLESNFSEILTEDNLWHRNTAMPIAVPIVLHLDFMCMTLKAHNLHILPTLREETNCLCTA